MLCGNCRIDVDEFDNYCNNCGQLIHIGRKYVQRWKREEEEYVTLKDRLVRDYKGRCLEEVFGGRQIDTGMGPCFLIESSVDGTITKPDKNRAVESLLSDLKLIYGIGKITEKKLKLQGYDTIEKLASHPRYRKEAKQFIDFLKNLDQENLIGWLCRWLSKSHPHFFCLSSFNDHKDFLILDIETLGLSNMPIILMGTARIEKGKILVKQYLARDYEEEAGLLLSLKNNITSKSAFITFNGAMFDIPFIKQRHRYYRLEPDLERVNFDMLYFCRHMLKGRFSSFKLKKKKKNLLNIEREQDIPGFLVPEFYLHYLDQKNIGPLVPLIHHNRQDLVSLASVFSKLHLEWEKY